MLSVLFKQEGEQVYNKCDNCDDQHRFFVICHRQASFIHAKSEAIRRNLQSVPYKLYSILNPYNNQ